ncbi:GerMN domain-containing protein [Planomonospora sp. ID67723]|uniref:GerMN domain-containing protein n=1 Tax=Planomonospora sp. ID67723 TaxID=2738134 RepID=UPI0018C3881E|nr:GerMN domain-containing protein [Planomonospora sp. ID67723]MBG0831979.1 GerMN domain-containing protein [Planomonospora sp. ID67723]
MLTTRPLTTRFLITATVTAGLLPVPAHAASAPAPPRETAARHSTQQNAPPAVPTLVDVRATHHPGLDRLVFEFRGPLPTRRSARYVTRLIGDPSGMTVRAAGNALLHLRFADATGHDDNGEVTYGPTRRTYPLPGVIQVVTTGDNEAVLSVGVGLAKRTPYRIYTLTRPNRVVVDIATPYRTVKVRTYFLNSRNFASGRTPYTTAVIRPVALPGTAYGALQRLFAGPTRAEYARGLRFTGSKVTGFSRLTVKNGIARVHLTGRCTSGGSTFTVADQITPTLRQFPSVRWVKIYDAAGRTERPAGRSDSVPECLEP